MKPITVHFASDEKEERKHMKNNYKELSIQKSLYRGCGESFAERL